MEIRLSYGKPIQNHQSQLKPSRLAWAIAFTVGWQMRYRSVSNAFCHLIETFQSDRCMPIDKSLEVSRRLKYDWRMF